MELTTVKLDDIKVETRIRDDLGDLSALVRSIRDVGLLFPLIVNKDNILISGGRRLEACRELGMTEVPAIQLDVDANSMRALDIQSGENLCRKALSNEELAKEIEMKKSAMPAAEPDPGVMSQFKNLFNKGSNL